MLTYAKYKLFYKWFNNMLSYQHSYHAGCFADVVKHIAHTNILEYMLKKDNPLFYFESHAGRGQYDLTDKHAKKTGEARDGIEKIWSNNSKLPDVFTTYIKIIQQMNPDKTLKFYPGSPFIAIDMLRKIDRAYLCELHPTEFEHLKKLKKFDKKLFCNNSNGMEQLIAQIPPHEKRALVFIDPSYELKDEYKTLPKIIKYAYQKFSTGVYCIWYPIIDNKLHEQLTKGLSTIPTKNYLKVEYTLKEVPQFGMKGCGLWIINPPFTLADSLKSANNIFESVLKLKSS